MSDKAIEEAPNELIQFLCFVPFCILENVIARLGEKVYNYIYQAYQNQIVEELI
jgi:hypothetical protein